MTVNRMFEDVIALLSAHRSEFADLVQDEFGRKITEEIIEPMMNEVVKMQERETDTNRACQYLINDMLNNKPQLPYHD